MAHNVPWDAKYNRPVVDGKVTNPTTGEVEEAGSQGYRVGPPMVDCIWHNMIVSADFRGCRSSFSASVDDVFIEITKHVRNGLYSIVSISASAYSFAIICKTDTTQVEFHEAWVQMCNNLNGNPPPL